MSEYIPSMTSVAVLCFLGTGFVLAVFLLLAVYGLIKRSRQLVQIAGIAGGLVLVSYCAVLLVFSVSSRDEDLAVGAKKYFCEIDCHLAYQVAAVSTDKAVGGESEQIVSRGEFVTIELQTWFDPATISPGRGDGPLTPNKRLAILTDSKGHGYTLSPRAGEVLGAKRVHSIPLSTSLRPGESYSSYLVFEVPLRAQGLRLWLRSEDGLGALLWGNELSPLHGKVRFRLNPAFRATRSSL